MITKRHALLATLLIGLLLLVWLSNFNSTVSIHADDENVRPTPTPARTLTPEADSPDVSRVPEDYYPDLVVSDISVSPDPPLVNRAVTIEVRISNIGTIPISDTNNFFVDLYINPDDPPRACLLGDYFWSIQGYEMSSGSLTLAETFYPEDEEELEVIREAFSDVGIVEIWAQVDTGDNQANNNCGNVIEEREDNNLRFITVDVDTRSEWLQTEPEEFLDGFSSGLDLTHPLGILQNGTGWFEEPRFPQPEEPDDWPFLTSSSPSFYNPDRHIWTDYLPDDYPLDQLDQWNPADQENVDIEIGFTPETLYAVWEDGRNGDLFDRDIYFSYSLDSGKTWLNPSLRINQFGEENPYPSNQLNPKLVIDRKGHKLYVFWEDNRLGDYDIFFARSNDFGFTWEEPGLTINPINDKEVDPNANQINVTAAAFYQDNCGRITCTHLFVAWEDYRNDNADIFFEWSQDGGETWLKTEDGDPETINANIYVQPDPDTNAGVYDQQEPYLFLDNTTSNGTINYCITDAYRIIYYDENNVPILDTKHYYPENPLPRVFIVWQDERDAVSDDPSSIYYTRGEFNYVHPEILVDQFGNPIGESSLCENSEPRAAIAQSNLPAYRFEDDHIKVNSEITTSLQLNPVGGFDDDGFISFQFDQTYTQGDSEAQIYICEVRFRTDELVISWEDNRNGTFDIWSTNIFDDLEFWNPVYAYVFDPEVSDPPDELYPDPNVGCLSTEQGGIGDLTAPTEPPDEIDISRNLDPLSPQPPEFYELSLPEADLEISNGLTFTPKPLCPTPNETATTFSAEPSVQTQPDLALLPISPFRITQNKSFEEQTFIASFSWNAWSDSRTIIDRVNQDIFLRPVVREDTSREMTILFSENMTPKLPSFQFGNRQEIALQTVQNNIKNQVVLRDLTLVDDLKAPSAQQNNPSVSFVFFGDENNANDLNNLENYIFYTGWDDNRNANPLIGFEGNKDIFAARLRLDDVLYDVLRPGRTASYVSPVFDANEDATWYDIEWWGDISVDGLVTLQTRFGDNPTPPQQNIAEDGWSQWTGVGGTGGTYSAPGQHITGPTGQQLPESRYIQYRINFNPAGGGQQDISCISEIDLNYEVPLDFLYLPLITGTEIDSGEPTPTPNPLATPTTSPLLGTVEGRVVSALTGSPIIEATVCTLSENICTNTDIDGTYVLSLAPGNYILRASADGYYDIDESVTVSTGQSVTSNFVLSPLLEVGEMRIVLTWGESPQDIDTHLWLPEATPAHIDWTNFGNCNSFPYACLDIDDRESFGPETITIRQRQEGTYVYGVFKFTSDGALTTSGARVQLYNSTGLIQEFNVPTTGDGSWWHVFDIDGATGGITVSNTISADSPGPYDPNPFIRQKE